MLGIELYLIAAHAILSVMVPRLSVLRLEGSCRGSRRLE